MDPRVLPPLGIASRGRTQRTPGVVSPHARSASRNFHAAASCAMWWVRTPVGRGSDVPRRAASAAASAPSTVVDAREPPPTPPVDEVDVGVEAGQRTLRPPPVTGEHPVPGRGERRRRVLSHPVPGRHEDREHALTEQGFEPFAPFAQLLRRDPSRRILRLPIAGRGVVRVGETVHEHVHRVGQHAGEGRLRRTAGMTARPSGQPGRKRRGGARARAKAPPRRRPATRG